MLGRARVTAFARRFGKRDVCAVVVVGHGCARAHANTERKTVTHAKRPHWPNNVFVLQPPSCPAHEAARISKGVSRSASGGDEPVRSAVGRTMHTRVRLTGYPHNRTAVTTATRYGRTAAATPRSHRATLTRLHVPGSFYHVPRLLKKGEAANEQGIITHTHTHTHDNPSFVRIASLPAERPNNIIIIIIIYNSKTNGRGVDFCRSGPGGMFARHSKRQTQRQ